MESIVDVVGLGEAGLVVVVDAASVGETASTALLDDAAVDEFPEWSVSGVLGRAGIGARWTDCPDLSPLYFVSLSPSNMSLPEYTRRCWAMAIFDLAATISFRSNTVHAGSTAVRANEGPPTTMTVRSIAALQGAAVNIAS